MLDTYTRYVVVDEGITEVIAQFTEREWNRANNMVGKHNEQLYSGRPGWVDLNDDPWMLLDVTEVDADTLETLNRIC